MEQRMPRAGSAPQMPGFTRWAVTNYDVTDVTVLPDDLKYMVYQHELCPTTNREHLQMYVVSKKQLTVAAARRRFPGAHVERAKGSEEKNRTYCTKTETRKPGTEPTELGERSKQGQRTDLTNFAELVENHGASAAAVEEPTMYLRFASNAHRLDAIYQQRVVAAQGWQPPTVLTLIGPTECGKTRLAHEIAHDDIYTLHYPEGNSKEFWDGYHGQKYVLLDDFYGQIKYTRMLTLLDGYASTRRIEIKNGHTYLRNHTWIITSNQHPCSWYPNVRNTDALMSRLFDREGWDQAVFLHTGTGWHQETSMVRAPAYVEPQAPPPRHVY